MLALQNSTWGLEVPNATRDTSHPLGVNTNLLSKVFITVLYILIFLVGTTGNVLTIQLVLKKQSLHGLQGTVHYHLVSLALSDILILVISIPIELYNFIWFHYPWVFGDAVCRGYYFFRDICSYATVLNIASLSCERYLAICHPMRAKRVMSKMRTKKILAAIWVSSLIFALPMAFIMGIKYENMSPDGEPDPSSLICTSLVSTATLKIFIQVNAFVSFVLPVTLIGGLNCITVSHLVSLRSRSSLIVHSSCKSPRASKELRKSQSSPSNLSRIPVGGTSWKKNLTVSSEPNRAIVIAYIVCWLPYHARRLMFCYIPDDDWSGSLYTFYHYFYMLTNTLFYISSAVNPVLYNVVSSSFRKLFLETLSPSCSKQNSNFSIKSSSSHIRPD